jgi:hypothetical protein
MSAVGPKRTRRSSAVESAFGAKADAEPNSYRGSFCPKAASGTAIWFAKLQTVWGDFKVERLMTTLIIEGLHRDVLKNRSFVTVTWKGEPEKRLGLPVPFDCQLDALKTETEKAVRALAKELETATIQGP